MRGSLDAILEAGYTTVGDLPGILVEIASAMATA